MPALFSFSEYKDKDEEPDLGADANHDVDVTDRLIVRVPRITKSYYDAIKGEGKNWLEDYCRKKAASEYALAKKDQANNLDNLHGLRKLPIGRNIGPAKGKTDLSGRPKTAGKSKPGTANEEEELLSYFDPEMVQPQYKKLLGKSRNIVVGPPKDILQKYFGYAKSDPLPKELQNDDSPKAFILPKYLWKDHEEKKQAAAAEELEMEKEREREKEKQTQATATAKPRKSKREREGPRTGIEQKLWQIIESGKSGATKNPLDFFKQPTKESELDDGDGKTDPRTYERDRTKCERKKRRESSFDEDVREKEDDYIVVCGSGSSSDVSLDAGLDQTEDDTIPTTNKSRLNGISSDPNISKKRRPSKKKNKKSSSVPDFEYERDGSDIFIDLGPDPMRRLPRDDTPSPRQIPYYRSFPLYPTLSNETFYEWYKDMDRLRDPFCPKKYLRPVGKSKSTGLHSGGIPMGRNFTGTPSFDAASYPFELDEPLTYSGNNKPERKNYDTRDYVYDNARSVMIMPPRKPIPRYVDDRKGTTHLLEPSGLVHKYVHKGDFARMPDYLKYRNIEQGRPRVPDFDKFYRFHRCKFVHGHIHCKGCDRPHPTSGNWRRGGDGDYGYGFGSGCEKFYNHLCDRECFEYDDDECDPSNAPSSQHDQTEVRKTVANTDTHRKTETDPDRKSGDHRRSTRSSDNRKRTDEEIPTNEVRSEGRNSKDDQQRNSTTETARKSGSSGCPGEYNQDMEEEEDCDDDEDDEDEDCEDDDEEGPPRTYNSEEATYVVNRISLLLQEHDRRTQEKLGLAYLSSEINIKKAPTHQNLNIDTAIGSNINISPSPSPLIKTNSSTSGSSCSTNYKY